MTTPVKDYLKRELSVGNHVLYAGNYSTFGCFVEGYITKIEGEHVTWTSIKSGRENKDEGRHNYTGNRRFFILNEVYTGPPVSPKTPIKPRKK